MSSLQAVSDFSGCFRQLLSQHVAEAASLCLDSSRLTIDALAWNFLASFPTYLHLSEARNLVVESLSIYARLASLPTMWLSKALVLDAPLKALEYRFRNLALMLADLLQVAGLSIIKMAGATETHK